MMSAVTGRLDVNHKTQLRQGGLQAEEPVSCEALLQTGMEMYDLEHFEILHEELLETRVLPHRLPVMLPERLLFFQC